MNKKVRMIVAVFLSLVMFMQNTCLNAYAAEIIPTGSGTLTASEPDMSLNAEISYGEAVIESFAYETSADVTILDHTRADVCNYIPEGLTAHI